MEFDMSREIQGLAGAWNTICFTDRNISRWEDKVFCLYGPKGCGKTKIAQEYVHSHAFAFYISFDNLTDREALASFVRTYLPGRSDLTGWKDAVDAFMDNRHYGSTLLIFDEAGLSADNGCYPCFLEYALKRKNVKICLISTHESLAPCGVQIRHRTIADFIKAFPNYSRYDTLRLYALTGGLLAVAKELDAGAAYEDNVRILLKYDSAFSRHLPELLRESFRSPESYFPILKSMADGHSRLSEIAKDAGYANNKCLNYLEALINSGFAAAEKQKGAKQSTYHLTSSYYAAWFRYVYAQKMLQIAAPKNLLQYLSEDIDEHLALPAFWSAGMRFIEDSWKDYMIDYRASEILETKKAVRVKIRNGHELILDYFVKTDDASYFFIFPHAIHEKYTKDRMEELFEAVDSFDSIYNTHIIVFSINRFSDWCVHQPAVNKWLHLVTIERLKY